MLNIVIIEMAACETTLESCVVGLGHQCLKIADSGQLLALLQQATPDLVMVSVTSPADELLADLQALNRHTPIPVVLFAKTCAEDRYARVLEAQVSEFIVNDLNYTRLPSSILIAKARFKQQQSLKNALEEARTQLEDRKQIDRAKAILIKTRNFTENEAYHTLRKLAMDRNITLGEMARNVIAMADLLK